MYNFIEGAPVDNVELLRLFVLRLRLAVAAHAGLRASADLGDAKVQHPLPCLLALSCRDDHAGVRNGDSDTGNDFRKGVVVNPVCK